MYRESVAEDPHSKPLSLYNCWIRNQTYLNTWTRLLRGNKEFGHGTMSCQLGPCEVEKSADTAKRDRQMPPTAKRDRLLRHLYRLPEKRERCGQSWWKRDLYTGSFRTTVENTSKIKSKRGGVCTSIQCLPFAGMLSDEHWVETRCQTSGVSLVLLRYQLFWNVQNENTY